MTLYKKLVFTKIMKGFTMREEWREIDEFVGYNVCKDSVIFNRYSGMELMPSLNQQGIPTVGLRKQGKGITCRRSVPVLVAKAFLPDPINEFFDTPIHLDGDRSNCHAENLAWRPRWFAIRYHQERMKEPFPDWAREFELIDTGEVYDHPRECAIQHGLLEKDICYSVMNGGRHIFPFGYGFRWYE